MKIELSDSIGYYLIFKNLPRFLIDFKQFERLHNDNIIWRETDIICLETDIKMDENMSKIAHCTNLYPYYNKKQNIKENLVEYLYTKLYDIKHINNNMYDLREANCIKTLKRSKHDQYIRQQYNVIDYIPGHNRTNSQNILYNMTWIVIMNQGSDEDDILNSSIYYMMYCEPDTLIKLSKKEYDQLMEYNKSIKYTLTWFRHTRKDNNVEYIIAKFNKSIVQLNQVITTFNKKTHIIKILDKSITKKKNDLRFNPFSSIDKEIRTKYKVIDIILGHTKDKGVYANIERNRIWVLETHYLMACEKDTLVKLCKDSYKKILDYEEKIGDKITWHKLENGYIGSTKCGLYMHQIIMNCYGNGKGTKNISVDHIDQDPTNNILSNLRIATRTEQEQNSKGIMLDTKRNRKHNAKSLPDGLTQDMMRKYVVYYKECYNKDKDLYREFFKIETHPLLDKIWISSKSNKIPLLDKLENANKVVDSLAVKSEIEV
jgi:hypothetical protein